MFVVFSSFHNPKHRQSASAPHIDSRTLRNRLRTEKCWFLRGPRTYSRALACWVALATPGAEGCSALPRTVAELKLGQSSLLVPLPTIATRAAPIIPTSPLPPPPATLPPLLYRFVDPGSRWGTGPAAAGRPNWGGSRAFTSGARPGLLALEISAPLLVWVAR